MTVQPARQYQIVMSVTRLDCRAQGPRKDHPVDRAGSPASWDTARTETAARADLLRETCRSSDCSRDCREEGHRRQAPVGRKARKARTHRIEPACRSPGRATTPLLLVSLAAPPCCLSLTRRAAARTIDNTLLDLRLSVVGWPHAIVLARMIRNVDELHPRLDTRRIRSKQLHVGYPPLLAGPRHDPGAIRGAVRFGSKQEAVGWNVRDSSPPIVHEMRPRFWPQHQVFLRYFFRL